MGTRLWTGKVDSDLDNPANWKIVGGWKERWNNTRWMLDGVDLAIDRLNQCQQQETLGV